MRNHLVTCILYFHFLFEEVEPRCLSAYSNYATDWKPGEPSFGVLHLPSFCLTLNIHTGCVPYPASYLVCNREFLLGVKRQSYET